MRIGHWRLFLAVAVVLAVTGSGVQAALAKGPAMAALVTLTGTVGRLPAGSGTVVLEAEIEAGRTVSGSHAAPKYLYDTVVASATIRKPGFSIPVRQSSVLRRAELQNHGTVNFVLIVNSGRRTTSLGFPVPLTPTAQRGNVVAAAIARTKTYQVPRLPRFAPMTARMLASSRSVTPADNTNCIWTAIGNSWEKTDPLGEGHVATDAGITDYYNLNYTNDVTMNFGGSSDEAGPFSLEGNVSLSDSWGDTGGLTLGGTSAGFHNYLGEQALWQRYFQNGAANCPTYYYKERDVQDYQNVLPEGDAGYDPFGGCENHSPEITLAPSGDWGMDRGQAESVSIGTFAYGMGISGSDGFTSDVNQHWSATSSAPYSYLCGYGNPASASVIWDTLH